MDTPAAFRAEDPAWIHAFVEANDFGMLVGAAPLKRKQSQNRVMADRIAAAAARDARGEHAAAAAREEGIPILTNDRAFAAHGVPTSW